MKKSFAIIALFFVLISASSCVGGKEKSENKAENKESESEIAMTTESESADSEVDFTSDDTENIDTTPSESFVESQNNQKKKYDEYVESVESGKSVDTDKGDEPKSDEITVKEKDGKNGNDEKSAENKSEVTTAEDISVTEVTDGNIIGSGIRLPDVEIEF